MKKYINKKNVILIILGLVLVTSLVFTLIVVNSDYSFELKFDDEQLNFFDEETLYFNESVDINFDGKGYISKINDDRFENSVTIDEDGIYILDIYKLLKHYSITIHMDTTPDIYLIDNDGNPIHNYLSNTSPFKVISGSEDVNVYVNNMTYTTQSLVEEAGNYIVKTDDDTYTVNILEINN